MAGGATSTAVAVMLYVSADSVTTVNSLSLSSHSLQTFLLNRKRPVYFHLPIQYEYSVYACEESKLTISRHVLCYIVVASSYCSCCSSHPVWCGRFGCLDQLAHIGLFQLFVMIPGPIRLLSACTGS